MEEYKLFFHNYFDFKGKTSRKEFWIPKLLNNFISLIATLYIYGSSRVYENFSEGIYITSMKNYHPKLHGLQSLVLVLSCLFLIFILIPAMSIGVRRFRDAGVNPWWFAFFTCSIVLFHYINFSAFYFDLVRKTFGILLFCGQIFIFLLPSKKQKLDLFEQDE